MEERTGPLCCECIHWRARTYPDKCERRLRQAPDLVRGGTMTIGERLDCREERRHPRASERMNCGREGEYWKVKPVSKREGIPQGVQN